MSQVPALLEVLKSCEDFIDTLTALIMFSDHDPEVVEIILLYLVGLSLGVRNGQKSSNRLAVALGMGLMHGRHDPIHHPKG